MFQFSGTLDIQMEDLGARLIMQGSDMILESDNPGEMFQALNIQKARGLSTVRRLAERFHRMGLTLTVVSRGKSVVVMGHKAKPGTASRLLRVPHVEVGSGTEIARLLTS